MINTQNQNQGMKVKRVSRSILLILSIMFLVISQVIVLLANSGSTVLLAGPGSAKEKDIMLDNLKTVNSDLKEVREILHEINAKPADVEVKKTEPEPSMVSAPVVEKTELVTTNKEKLELKSVNVEIPETGKELNDNNSVNVKSIVSNPVLIQPALAPTVRSVVKINKQNAVPEIKVTDNKKVELKEKDLPAGISRVVVEPASVSADAVAIDTIEKRHEEAVTAHIKHAYVKYDINGRTVEDNNEQWSCVFDTESGLMWEVKSKDDTLRNPDNLYSWFNPDNTTLKGVTDGGRCKGGTACDTNAYIEAMNRQKFCGHDDWRLPTQEEMMGLVNYENSDSKIKIDTSYFPYALPSWYWTASSNKSRPEYAWYVLFKNGMSLNDLKENPKHVRLVRSQSSS